MVQRKISLFRLRLKMKIKNLHQDVHLKHCYQGEYEDSCKYGENDCPAKFNKSTEINIEIIVTHNTKIESLTTEIITDEERLSITFKEGEPEDNTLYRDLEDAWNITEMLIMAYDAGKRGEELEVKTRETK